VEVFYLGTVDFWIDLILFCWRHRQFGQYATCCIDEIF
jgi:hypothetical protein